jgi:glycosyltransferase involved in cell wall biosynthesis
VTSIVIAAHNEAPVIGRCLDAVLDDPSAGPVEIVVAANGCSDDTAAVAGRRSGVRVIELAEASKPAALNAADAAATGFPRIYLDADIVLPPGSVGALRAALSRPGCLAAMPAREFDLRGRPLPVRAFYAINVRLPVYRTALFGRGVIALSAQGRSRFGAFPDLTADDLFLDALFTAQEKHQVDAVRARIATPRRTRDLVRRLARVRTGNRSMRATTTGVRSASNSSWLTDVVLRRPWLAPAGVCYVAVIAAAELTARRSAGRPDWGQDRSSR